MLPPVGARPLTRQRFAVGTWDSTGRYDNPAPVESAFYGSFQPIARKLQRESGGERDNATHWCSALVNFQVSNPDGGPVADNIVVPTGTFAGTYQVVEVKPFDEFAPLTHHEVKVIEANEPDPVSPNLATTVPEKLLQTCRTMIKATGIPTPYTDAQVVVQQASPMPRPPLPYLAVIVDSYDETVQATDSQQFTWSDMLTITGGAEGDEYQILWGVSDSVSYTRLLADTDTDVATALCAAMIATGDFETEQAGPVFALTALIDAGTVSVTGLIDLQTHALPATIQSGLRVSTLSLWGYGTDSRPWIERVRAWLASPAGLAAQSAGGVAVAPAGDVVQESVDLGTGYEDRYSCVLTLSYSLQSVAQTGLEATTILVSGSVSSSGASALPFTAIVEP